MSEKQKKEAAPPVIPPNHVPEKTEYYLAEVSSIDICFSLVCLCMYNVSFGFLSLPLLTCPFVLQAKHSFDAESEKELSLAVGDYVVVRKVCSLSISIFVCLLEP